MAPLQSCYIHKLNVVRFETLLMREQQPSKRATLAKLLSEEQVLLAEALEREGASVEALVAPRHQSTQP